MKKNKKAMIASLVLVGAVCVGSTLAYLSDQSNTLTNSFTVGQGYVPDEDLKQAVWVDEKDYDGEQDVNDDTLGEDFYYVGDELRTLKGNNYGTDTNKLEAGSVVVKDPVIRLTEASVDSWVYMQVTYKKGEVYSFLKGEASNKDLAEVIGDKWTEISNTDDGENVVLVVRYNKRLNSTKEGEDLIHNTEALFDHIRIDSTFEGQPTITPITIKACAVQAVYTDNGTKVYLEPNDAETTSPKADAPKFE
ncbi:SipW-dependent-type signal peptide-containing protein [Massilimicrobiota timonensis]|uniref:Uncharacterized protein n=1 Tax=Massilimicrobiota timonensis TaxID=1776392 RepID=A0A1Y4SYL1_9FIRM|nr:SipW-dependent-type signal peptide-containing protein [Massilimicrobiota timonensis]OUQ34032.1 hypothetical protein B5E75_08220 [Massilimicrobiota timonensis]